MSDLYEDDILLWAERQSDLLRRRAAGELVNDGESSIGRTSPRRSKTRGAVSCMGSSSLLTQALLHMLKAKSWPSARDVPNWQLDARLFHRQARRRFVPSMRQRIDLAALYADALAGLPDDDGWPAAAARREVSIG